jgi:hypothetical protein
MEVNQMMSLCPLVMVGMETLDRDFIIDKRYTHSPKLIGSSFKLSIDWLFTVCIATLLQWSPCLFFMFVNKSQL